MPDVFRKHRRTRVDSPAGVTLAIIAGGKKIALPSGMKFDAAERTAFTEICEEFSKSELTAHKIRLAGLLARQVAMLNGEESALMIEGSTLSNDRGARVANPRVRAVAILTASILGFRRSLGLHARAQAGGDNRLVGVRRAHNKANETMLDDIDEEGLLARPPLFLVDGGHDDDD
jgi:hypothetical protein